MKSVFVLLSLLLSLQAAAGGYSSKATSTKIVGKNAVLRAASTGDTKALKSLIAKKANLSQRDQSGNTPLFFAISNEHTEAAKILINAGANLKNFDQFGESALMTAVSFNNLELIQLILKKNPKLLNMPTSEKQTPIMKAAEVGSVATVKLLIAAGADLKARDKLKRTAYEIARESQNSDSLRLLKPKE